jgi:hypothetical protein
MPKIEGKFAIGGITEDGVEYITVRPEPEGEKLFYVSDNGQRYEIENYDPKYLLLRPVAALVPKADAKRQAS